MGDFIGVFSNARASFGFIVGVVEYSPDAMSPYYVVEFLEGVRLRILEESAFRAICTFVGPIVITSDSCPSALAPPG